MNHMEKTLGTNPANCGEEHSYFNVYSVGQIDLGYGIYLRVGGLSTADWVWATEKFGLTTETTGLMTCNDCEQDRPSRLALIAKNVARANAAKNEPRLPQAEEDEAEVHCPDCDENFAADAMVQVRYCTFCEVTFNGTDNGRNCEECNRPFTRKCTDNGCPECLSEESECEQLS